MLVHKQFPSGECMAPGGAVKVSP